MVSARVFFIREDLKNFLDRSNSAAGKQASIHEVKNPSESKIKNNFNLGTPTPLKFRTKFPPTLFHEIKTS